MFFPSRVNQSKSKTTTRRTTSHHKKTCIISNKDVPSTNLTYYARIWFQKLRKTMKSVGQDNNWPGHLPDTSHKRRWSSDATKLKCRRYSVYARNQNYPIASSFSFTSFLKRDAGYIDALGGEYSCRLFVSGGKYRRKNEGHTVLPLPLTPNSFPNTGILPL
jgi:hypothetical protein